MANEILHNFFQRELPNLSTVLKQRYALFDNTVHLEGKVDVFVSKPYALLAPILRWVGGLAPYAGNEVKAVVKIENEVESNRQVMTRHFHYDNNKKYNFTSYLIANQNNLIEYMKPGFGVKFICKVEEDKLILEHQSYIWRIRDMIIVNLPKLPQLKTRVQQSDIYIA